MAFEHRAGSQPLVNRQGMPSRREVMKVAGSMALALGCGADESIDLGFAEGDTFDDVLDKLHATDPEHADGQSNHAPMAAEALLALGRQDRVLGYVRGYATGLRFLSSQLALGPEERALALGDVSRVPAWIAAFEKELLTEEPRKVFGRNWDVLAPGLSAAGFHGLIRTGHAIRSLEGAENPTRRRELAHALGYWAGRHRPLPGTPGARREAGLDVVAALGRVKKVPGFEKQPRELIYQRMSWVDGNSEFLDVVEQVDLDAVPVENALTELAAAAARLFTLAGGVGYLHAVTGTSAFRLVLPWLGAEAARAGLGFLFQAVAALHATFPSGEGLPTSVTPTDQSPEALRARGGTSNDEHVIKLVEAALREHELAPRPEFLAAAHSVTK